MLEFITNDQPEWSGPLLPWTFPRRGNVNDAWRELDELSIMNAGGWRVSLPPSPPPTPDLSDAEHAIIRMLARRAARRWLAEQRITGSEPNA